MARPPLRIAAALLAAGLYATAPAAADGDRRQLAEQKLRLVATLLDSAALKGAAGSPEAGALAASARQRLEQARSRLQGAQEEEAIRELDEALKEVSKASSLVAGNPQAGAAASARQFRERAAEVDSYRRAFEELAAAPATAAEAKRLLAGIDRLAAEARREVEAGRPEAGLKKINEAHQLAVGELSRLRRGQEVVLRLVFDSPREEFDYEQKRYHSNEILVAMLLREERASAETLAQIDKLQQAAATLKEQAAAKARAGDYADAVKEMENAGRQLNRALQLLGVPVF